MVGTRSASGLAMIGLTVVMFDGAYARGTRSVLVCSCCRVSLVTRRLASSSRTSSSPDFTKRSGLPPWNSSCVVSTSVAVFASRLSLSPNFVRRRRRRLAAEDSPVSDANGADLDGADTLLDTTDTPGQAGGAGAGNDAGSDAGNGPVDEEEEEDGGDVSDPPPMEYNVDRDREIDEDPDHSDGGDDAGAGEEVRACARGCLFVMITAKESDQRVLASRHDYDAMWRRRWCFIRERLRG